MLKKEEDENRVNTGKGRIDEMRPMLENAGERVHKGRFHANYEMEGKRSTTRGLERWCTRRSICWVKLIPGLRATLSTCFQHIFRALIGEAAYLTYSMEGGTDLEWVSGRRKV